MPNWSTLAWNFFLVQFKLIGAQQTFLAGMEVVRPFPVHWGGGGMMMEDFGQGEACA